MAEGRREFECWGCGGLSDFDVAFRARDEAIRDRLGVDPAVWDRMVASASWSTHLPLRAAPLQEAAGLPFEEANERLATAERLGLLQAAHGVGYVPAKLLCERCYRQRTDAAQTATPPGSGHGRRSRP